MARPEQQASAKAAPQAGGVGEGVLARTARAASACVMSSRKSVLDGELPALHALRLAAVAHIFAMNHGRSTRFALWGSSWIPFLFLLSGFGACYARLQVGAWSPGICPRPRTIIRRWASVYPLYVLGLLWDAALQLAASPPETWEQVKLCAQELGINLLMLQAYFTDQYYSSTYNPPGWFCSALVLLWLLEEAICSLAAYCWWRGARGRVAALVGMAVWVVLWPYAGFPLTGERLNVRGLEYIHCFFCGCLLALPIQERHDGLLASLAKKPLFSCAPASHAILLLLITFVLVDSPSLIERWGAILVLPLQCMLVYGTAVFYDPLVATLSVWPLPLAHKVAFGIYILQVPTARTVECVLGWPEPLNGPQLLFIFLVLLTVAAVTHEAVHRPLSAALCRFAS